MLALLSEPCLHSPSPVPISVPFQGNLPHLGLLRHIPAKPKALGAPRQGTCQGYDPRHVPHPKPSLNSSGLLNQCCPFPPCPPSDGNPSPLFAAGIPSGLRIAPGNVLTPPPPPLDGSGGGREPCGTFTCKKQSFPMSNLLQKQENQDRNHQEFSCSPLNCYLRRSSPSELLCRGIVGLRGSPTLISTAEGGWMGSVAGSIAFSGAPGQGQGMVGTV